MKKGVSMNKRINHLKPLSVLTAAAIITTSLFPANALAAEPSDTSEEGYLSEYSSYRMDDSEVDPMWTPVYGHWELDDDTLYYMPGEGTSVDVPSIADKVEEIVFKSGPTSVTRDFYLSDCYFPNLEEVEFEAPVTLYNGDCTIETSAFANSPKLKKLTVGNYDKEGIEFNKKAFMNCPSLTDVSLGLGTWHFGYMTFGNCTGLTKFEFPDDMHNVRGDSFIGCENLSTLKLADTNSYMKAIDNAIYEFLDPYSNTRGDCYITPCLMFVPEGLVKKAGGSYTIRYGTKDVQYWAFMGNKSLKELTVASTVESIQHEAFYDCQSLNTIRLPKSLKRIGQNAFGPRYNSYYDSYTASDMESEDTVDIMHHDHDYDYNVAKSSLKTIYYEGSESDWQKIKLAEYDLDYGHLRNMHIESETTLYDNLSEAGIPDDVKIIYNTPITDTTDSLDDLINKKVTMSFNSKDSADLKTLGIDLSIEYTSAVKYNGRKHIASFSKAKGNTANDIDINVKITDINTGKESGSIAVKKIIYKNNKDVAAADSKKAPYFILQLKAVGELSKEQKKALKNVNKILKKSNESGTKFYFDITPLSISSMTSENYKGLKLTEKKGITTAKFKVLALEFKYTKDGEQKTTWIKLKPCKKNNSSNKGDYTYVINSDKTITVTGQHNFKGSATFKLN